MELHGRQTIRRAIGDVRVWDIEAARTEARRLAVVVRSEKADPREIERQQQEAKQQAISVTGITLWDSAAPSSTRSVPALRAANCRPGAVLAPGQLSGASRGCFRQWPAARHLVCAPPTLGLARFACIDLLVLL